MEQTELSRMGALIAPWGRFWSLNTSSSFPGMGIRTAPGTFHNLAAVAHCPTVNPYGETGLAGFTAPVIVECFASDDSRNQLSWAVHIKPPAMQTAATMQEPRMVPVRIFLIRTLASV